MAFDHCERSQIYDRCHAIFSGQKAQLRRRVPVLKELKTNMSSVAPLAKSMGWEKLLQITQQLLQEKVFESKEMAKTKFPELFKSSVPSNSNIQAETRPETTSATVTLSNQAEPEGSGHSGDLPSGSNNETNRLKSSCEGPQACGAKSPSGSCARVMPGQFTGMAHFYVELTDHT